MKALLIKWLKLMLMFGALVIGYILLDYSFNQASPKTYQFKIPEFKLNTPVILKQENMMIIVARYSQSFVKGLQPGGRLSKISSSFTNPQKLIDKEGYFIVLGYGTHVGCPLVIEQHAFKESCSDARYSWTGKSQNPALYDSLEKVDYKFSQNHTVLTIN